MSNWKSSPLTALQAAADPGLGESSKRALPGAATSVPMPRAAAGRTGSGRARRQSCERQPRVPWQWGARPWPGLCIAAFSSSLTLFGLSGCMTASAGSERRRQLEERISELSARTDQRDQAIEAKLSELADGLERARTLLTRDSADVGAQVQAQQQRMAELEGQLAEMTHSLNDLVEQTARARAELDDKLGKLSGKAGEITLEPSQIPSDKAAHFNAAYDAYKAGEQEKARALFREYVTRYPDDTKTGDAQYWVGATYLVQNKPATALGEYRKVIALYPKSPAVDTALYGMADAFFRLHACTDAKGAIEALTKRKPSKTLEERAKQLNKAVRDAPKGYCAS